MEEIDLAHGGKTPKVYGVSELTEEIGRALEDRFDFVWVEGEVSNFSAPVSGHYYMVLKDSGAQIKTVMFRLQARYLRFVPENGMRVIAQGKIGLYPPRGEYQLVLDYLEPMGFGALAAAFEQLKEKLYEKGVFDERIKKPLPFLPRKVAVITSPTGAAVRDFLKVILRRFSNIEIVIVPVRVQGEGASGDIVQALKVVNERVKSDVIVLTRGGGSLEDLWAFNQEELAYAIRASSIPVVSAVGHEIDLTISDLAADFRAPTPSAAAELLVSEKEMLTSRLGEVGCRLVSCMNAVLKRSTRDLDRLTRSLGDPRRRLAEQWMRLDDVCSRLTRSTLSILEGGRRRLGEERRALLFHSPARSVSTLTQDLAYHQRSLSLSMERSLKERRMSIAFLKERMEGLNPLSVLKRGYSISRKLPEGKILRDVSGLERGDRVHLSLAKGEMTCRVEEIRQGADGEAFFRFDKEKNRL